MLGEPASLGTLLELGNCTLDILRDLVNHTPSQSMTTLTVKTVPSTEPLDVRQSVITARRNLEGILTYAVTQLVMWLSKPEFEPPVTNEIEIEADSGVASMDVTGRPDHSLLKDRTRTPSARAMTMAERLRRGMTSEMASDLKELLSKSKPIVAKSTAIVGGGSTDIIQVLINFLQDHVISTV